MTTVGARRRRTLADLVHGTGALVVTVGLLCGVPWALLQVGATPLPGALPSLDALVALVTTPDDGSLFLSALTWAGWLGWGSFALAVAVETAAGLLHRPAPRLPALGPQQHLVRRLLTGIGLLLSAPVLIALPPAHASAPTAVVATAPVTTTQGPVAAGAADAGSTSAVEVVVTSGDTLSAIAEDHLADADRYPEIADASRGIVQADGRTLTDPDLIHPGWVLRLPGTGVPAPDGGPAASAAPTPDPPTATPAPTPVPAPPATAPAPPATPLPSTAAPQPGGPASEAGPTVVDPATDGIDATVALTATGLGALTAAGVVAAVTRRRARQQRHRRPGRRLPPQDAASAAVERQLRVVQDPFTAADLDAALRAVADTCHRTGTDLPQVRYARVLASRIELHTAHGGPAVAPFASTSADDTAWVLHREEPAETQLPPDVSDGGPAPYPALVPAGRDLDGAEVLLDLEAAGLCTITGSRPSPWGEAADPAAPHAVVAALAVALATSPCAADVEITLVGAHRDLARAVAVETLDHTEDLDHLLDEVTAWAASVRAGLDSEGLPDAAAARRARRAPDAWGARVLLIATHTTTAQVERLLALTAAEPAVPLAVVLTQAEDTASWTLALHDDGHLATVHPLALTLVPQTLQPAVLRLITDVPNAAAAVTGEHDAVEAVGVHDLRAEALETPVPVRDEAVPVPPPGAEAPVEPSGAVEPPASAGPVVTDDPVTADPLLVRVLGPVEVDGARGAMGETSHRARMTEVVAFLALHPHGEHHLLDEALWPGERVPDGRRNQLVSRARRWLGSDDHGRPYVAAVNPDGYRLTDRVRTDWAAFTDLVGPDPRRASTSGLHAALALVRGQPFAGVNPRRYAWADIDRQEMISAIVDTAHEAGRRAYRADDAATARRAAATGLLAEPGSELLWRDALRAEWLAGDHGGLEALAERFTRLAEQLGDDLEEETELLLGELLRPSHRTFQTVGATRAQ